MTNATTPAPAPEAMVRAYLNRIGFAGRPAVDRATLAALHRCHVEAIAWECLDVFCGRPVTRDPQAAFDKIVRGGRGGWCYEMNGLFAWMLESIGFRVTRLAGAVMREEMGDAVIGNHLLLLVDLDCPYVADVGLGSGLIEPLPLAEGEIRQRFRRFALERLEGGWWRFRNHPGSLPTSYDFSPAVRDEALLEDRCHWLQTDPASPFLRNAVVQRYFPDRLETLVGASAYRVDGDGLAVRELDDGRAYAGHLEQVFGLRVPEPDVLWARIDARAAAA